MVDHQLSPADIAHLLRVGYNVIISTIREMEKPVVAAINGVAAGIGLSLALACDMRLCAANAVLTTGFARIGLIPDGGQTALLPLLVGYARAAELVFFSERIDAASAMQMGLVNKVVPPEALASETHALAERLAALPTRAIGLSKQAFNQALLPHLASQLDLEAELQARAMQTDDHREGIAAFLEKRAASFSGS
jgi:2-(1,2-epoxy-1,2-dihydrophenyl)acetyl-CoA isomerase